MGLIQAAVGSLGGVLADQWKEYFYCEALSENVLAAKGKKHQSARSSNTKGSDNIITNGSVIAVADGQCMLIVEQGKIVDVCAEPGAYTYDTSTEPSIFAGKLGTSILDTFKLIGKRFTFGGDTGNDQRIYYFNTKEIIGNKYGTANPVPFRVYYPNINLDTEVSIRCFGEYSYHIANPLLFYTSIAGNFTDTFTRDRIDSQLKSELLTALQPAFARISDMGIRYSSLPAHTTEMADALNDVLSKKWGELRGLEIVSFGVSSVTANPEDEERIKKLQNAAASTFGTMVVGETLQGAATNPNGAMMGFMGMNMAANSMNQATGGMGGLHMYQPPTQPAQPAAPAAPANGWKCPSCGANATGKFCPECGTKKPEADAGWKCPTCGAMNKGRFCSECGAKKPAGVPQYKCDKCGWEPKDPTNPPKFCLECGDPFGAEDITNK